MERIRQAALLATPPMVLGTMSFAFARLGRRFGPRRGYFLGLLLYWIGWCFLFPLWVLGPRGLIGSFRGTRERAGEMPMAGVVGLAMPPIIGITAALPRQLPRADTTVIFESLAIAAVNASGEELLWRATYLEAFPRRQFVGYLYPAAGFAVWHLAPQIVVPSKYPGGAVSFVTFCGVLGLLYGWVARRTRSVRWTTLSHVLLDFSGLGALAFRGESTPTKQ